MTLLAALSLLIWIYLLAAHGRFWQSGPVLPLRRPDAAPAVAVVVPARDEAPVIAGSLRSLLAQDYAGPVRVILVDDGSTDGTGAIALAVGGSVAGVRYDAAPPPGERQGPIPVMAGEGPPSTPLAQSALQGVDGPPARTMTEATANAPQPPRSLTVIEAGPRPPGWSGKLWAVSRGIAEAGDTGLVLLTDADIVHEPAHLSALVAQIERHDLDLVSEMVALACDSPAERALVPAFVFFFQLLYPFSRVNDGANRTAAAAGGTILIRQRALRRIGGVDSVRAALIDDVALAEAVKQGGPIWLGHATLARSVRPYPAFADIWRMVARTAYVQLRFSPALLAATTAGMGLTFLVPPAATLLGHGAAAWCGLAAWIMLAASYLPTLRRFGRSAVWAPLLPLVAGFYMAATIGSAVNHHLGRGVAWKGRDYQGTEA
jgi:hopene-associated glycosyltransferase HpnB